jgi:hypothetical protein
MANHIKIVAILLIVQGALEVVMGAFFTILGPVMFGLIKWSATKTAASSPTPDDLAAGIVSGIYLLMGLPVLAIGIFRIIAGIRNLSYRGRVMGMVALAVGAISVMTCYCLPTSIGLMVYGLVAYLDPQSQRAFALGEQGRPADEILAEITRASGQMPPGERRFG